MIKRIIEPKLRKYLANCGAVLVTGPKFCGKTFISQTVAKSMYEIEPEQVNESNYEIYSKEILSGENPRLIDEWQNYPRIWDKVRRAVDNAPSGHKTGLYILTGSSTPVDRNKTWHSGAGRITVLNMHTLTFAEILNYDADKTISIKDLFEGKPLPSLGCQLTYKDVNKMLYLGGWPYIYNENITDPEVVINGYVESLSNSNLETYYDLRINNSVINKILISLARRIGTQTNKKAILEDIKSCIDRETLEKYIQMFYDIDLIYQLEAWNNHNIRSTYKLRTKPKVYLCDSSLFCSILNVTSPDKLIDDINSLGLLYENQVIKDLMVYADSLDAKLYFYRDENDNEIDVIFEMRDGRWAAIEIKLSLQAAANASLKLDKVIQTMKMTGEHKDPTFRMVICNCPTSFETPSGVYIVPFGLLRP